MVCEVLGWAVTPRPWRPHTQSSAEQPGGTTHLESFELPSECIFEGCYQLALKLDDASGIWERHRIQIEHLAKEVNQSYSIIHATSLLDHHLGDN
jgi:hypothetical protein